MRTIALPVLGTKVSALGFGCAPLGSRMSARAGSRLIEEAIDRGVNWFDVAPPYGDGNAEKILGGSLRGHRASVYIATKAGLGIPRISIIRSALRPVARTALRALTRRQSAFASFGRLPIRNFAPNAIELSVVQSLRRLNTDYVDVLNLHEPTLNEEQSEGVIRVLESMQSRGMIRAFGVAGSVTQTEDNVDGRYKVRQFAHHPLSPFPRHLGETLGERLLITHSIFWPEAARRLLKGLNSKVVMANELEKSYGLKSVELCYRLLLDYAFAYNSNGIVLTTMSSRNHLRNNCAVADRAPERSAITIIDRLIEKPGQND